MSTNPNVKNTDALHEAFNVGSMNICLELASDDIEVVFQPTGQVARGREGFQQFMQGFKNAFPDIRITHTNVVAEGDQVAVEFNWSGTHTGPLMGPAGAIPATGKRVTNGHVCEVMTWKKGKLTRLVNYQDFGAVLRQLGL
jgi:steroid delta-isomerase-like uncharacterized protein